MTPENFCYWLQGFFEIQRPNGLNPNQLKEIQNHLDLVFKKITPIFPATTSPFSKNNSWSRRLIVCAVDGINVLDGQAAGSSKAGYVINGYNSIEIKGFRTSNENVNAFKFSSKEKSYAALSEETKGDTRNCGVIGVEVYSEKEKPLRQTPIIIERIIEKEVPVTWIYPKPWWDTPNTYPYTITCNSSARDLYESQSKISPRSLGGMSSMNFSASMRCSNDNPSVNLCSVQNSAETVTDFDMGTEFSDKEITDSVKEVEFETGLLLTTFEIFYASRSALLNMSIPLVKETQISLPQSFPSKFCKPPHR